MRSRLLFAALPLLFIAGCGPALYHVHGKVAYADGTPLTEGMVVCESTDAQPPLTARGEIQADGTFALSTHRPGDGLLPGRYRVLVAPKYDANAVDKPARRPPFDPRFADFGTSGLEFEVKASGPNDLPITVTKAKKK